VKEVQIPTGEKADAAASFVACVATVLELPFDEVPRPRVGEDPAAGWTVSRWLGRFGMGLARIHEPASFSWPGPWIARVQAGASSDAADRRFVVMFGVPSGVVWDPAGTTEPAAEELEEGFLIAAADIALAPPPRAEAPLAAGSVEAIWLAGSAGEPGRSVHAAEAIAGKGLAGDRHTIGKGTFPSGPPGSALTLIEAEVCQSFDPPLRAAEHRRNLVTSGIDLNALVGHEFTIGAVRCRGMRLCEPCTVVQRYASRPVLRALVHRGGLRADILEDGELRVGDEVRALGPQ
jgi:MOSC domain